MFDLWKMRTDEFVCGDFKYDHFLAKCSMFRLLAPQEFKDCIKGMLIYYDLLGKSWFL